jgi:sugar lactone lactonase YvrE
MAGAAPALARLARVEPDGTAFVAAEGLYFPNGSMLTPDGRTLIVCETMGNRISAFDVRVDGTLGPRRDWAVFGDLPTATDVGGVLGSLKAAPDGTVLDAEGAVWFADAAGNRAVRMAPGGKILQAISTGDMGCFALTLGGPDRRTLFLCVAPDFHEAARQAAREAAIWATRVDVPGAGAP